MSTLTISGRHPLSRIGITPKVVVLVLIFGFGTIPPLLYLVAASVHDFHPDGAFGEMTLAHFREMFSSRAFFATLFNSVVYSLGSALVALVIGAAQAWLAER